jgi:hypothetical protein
LRLKAVGTVAATFLATLAAAKEEIAGERTVLIEVRRSRDNLLAAGGGRSNRILFHGVDRVIKDLHSFDRLLCSRRRVGDLR